MNNSPVLSIICLYDKKITLSKSHKVEFIYLEDINSRLKYSKTLQKNNKDSDINSALILCKGNWVLITESKVDDNLVINALKQINSNDSSVIGGYEEYLSLKLLLKKDVSKSLPFIYKKEFLFNVLPLKYSSDIQKLRLAQKAYSSFDLRLSKEYTNTIKNTGIYVSSLRLPITSFIKYRIFKVAVNNRFKPLEIDYRYLEFNKNIPIFINCRDRLAPLKRLVNWLEADGFTNIILIDNNSSYKPLLAYYKNSKNTVINLHDNIGQQAPWVCGAVKVFAKNTPYIVTDPDIIPSEKAHGKLPALFELLNEYKDILKVGFALNINNLPDHYQPKDKVIRWEQQFWEKEIKKNVYYADIDTTFALYRPNVPYLIRPALRIAGDITAEHEPWYQDSLKPTKEYIYYSKNARREINSWGLSNDSVAKVYK